MKFFLGIVILIFSLHFCKAQTQSEIPLIKYEDLEKEILRQKDVFLVLNFWSTTCAPCVKELPHFMEVNSKYRAHIRFKMLLVSLDRAKDKDKVAEFISKRNLSAEVILLDDVKRMNTWIPKFEKSWEGNIPVTVFYRNGEKVYFNNGEMSKEELENTIDKYFTK